MRCSLRMAFATLAVVQTAACRQAPTPPAPDEPSRHEQPAPHPPPPASGSTVCSSDGDCQLNASCVGCNRCSATPFIGPEDNDCMAECQPDRSLGCRCVQGQCEVTTQNSAGGLQPGSSPLLGKLPVTRPQGRLQVAPSPAVAAQPVMISYDLPGADSCYRQSGVENLVDGLTIRHVYRTWSEGQGCSEAKVAGGFSTELTLPSAGDYLGTVQVNDVEVASYHLKVQPPPPPPRPAPELARAYLKALRARDRTRATRALAELDQALDSGPPVPAQRVRYGFPGEVGLGELELGGHLLAAGGESGALHLSLLRRGYLVPLGDLSTGASYLRNRPAVDGLVAYVGLQDGGLLKIDLLTGRHLWQAGIGSIRYSDPLLHGKRVFVVGKGALYALDAATGNIRWKNAFAGADDYYGDASVRWRQGQLALTVAANRRGDVSYIEHRMDPATGKTLRSQTVARWGDDRPVAVIGDFPVRPRVMWNTLVCELTEGPRWGNCNGPHLVCRAGGTLAFDVGADTWDCVSGDFEEPILVGPLLFTGSTAVDLSYHEESATQKN
ncbi:MAG: PQQ-binding-like beta-propeller repeat protein [Pseudomonadota bacterium]